ncbi:MAG: TonB family protein [Candidatus Methylomirabilales bacterium]
MREWSNRLSRISLPWVFSLSLHFAALALLYRWGVNPALFQGERALEVKLVHLGRGSGGASHLGGADRPSLQEVGRSGGARISELPLIEEPHHSRKNRGGTVGPPIPQRPAAVADLAPSARVLRKESKRATPASAAKSQAPDVAASRPVVSDEPVRRPGAGGPSGRDETRGHHTERPKGLAGERSDLGLGVTPMAEPAEAGTGDRGVAAGRQGSGIGARFGIGKGQGSRGGGTGGFRLLRRRIERAKRYPPQARRWGMEGTAEVQFRIAGDGSVEGMMIVKSSGFPLLDQASLETIRRAAPLPVIPGTIRVPISYRLRDER